MYPSTQPLPIEVFLISSDSEWLVATSDGARYSTPSRDVLEEWWRQGRVGEDCWLYHASLGAWKRPSEVFEVRTSSPPSNRGRRSLTAALVVAGCLGIVVLSLAAVVMVGFVAGISSASADAPAGAAVQGEAPVLPANESEAERVYEESVLELLAPVQQAQDAANEWTRASDRIIGFSPNNPMQKPRPHPDWKNQMKNLTEETVAEYKRLDAELTENEKRFKRISIPHAYTEHAQEVREIFRLHEDELRTVKKAAGKDTALIKEAGRLLREKRRRSLQALEYIRERQRARAAMPVAPTPDWGSEENVHP
jgi:hypothetical protein